MDNSLIHKTIINWKEKMWILKITPIINYYNTNNTYGMWILSLYNYYKDQVLTYLGNTLCILPGRSLLLRCLSSISSVIVY